MTRNTTIGAALAALLLAAWPAGAQNLRIGMSAETTSADPHNYAVTPNSTLKAHLFDALVDTDAKLEITPALATRWERTDDLTWVFHLREGVRFHDGAAFTAEDALASFCRALNNEAEVVQSFSRVPRRFAKVEVVDARTLRIVTRQPEPLLLADLSNVAIIPRSLVPAGRLDFTAERCGVQGDWPRPEAFNDGRAAIGTGPYRLRSYQRGGVIELTRFDNYWGERPHWAEVQLRPVTAAGPRLAGLLAGDVDVIEAPATSDLARLRTLPEVAIHTSPTSRLVFLQLDVARSPSPFVAGGTGPNPLRDVRVRQALSLAIDRRALFSRVMDEVSVPAAQYALDGAAGTVPGLPPLPYDPARARALLAEAGFRDGFAMTFHATNNRYINDSRLAQAITQYWQRIGVKVELDAMPASVFFTRRGRRELSVAMGGWSADANETLPFFRTWLMSTDAPRGNGTSNYGGWSEPRFDGPAARAMSAMDPAARAALLREASEVALAEMPMIPIHFESAVWATRKGLAYPGRVDQVTLATEIRPAP